MYDMYVCVHACVCMCVLCMACTCVRGCDVCIFVHGIGEAMTHALRYQRDRATVAKLPTLGAQTTEVWGLTVMGTRSVSQGSIGTAGWRKGASLSASSPRSGNVATASHDILSL